MREKLFQDEEEDVSQLRFRFQEYFTSIAFPYLMMSAFLHPRLRMPCIFNLTFRAFLSYPWQISRDILLSAHTRLVRLFPTIGYVPFRVLCWLEFKKFQGFFTWWSIWNNRRGKRVNGMLRLDLLLKRFSSSVQIRCGFIDLWGNNRNYAEDFHSIILPKHPFVRFHCTYQYLSNIDTFRWIWMAGRFDGQI